MQLVPYGAALTIYRPMILGGAYLTSAPTIAAGDVQISKDGGAFANVATLPTFSNEQLAVVLSATELQAGQVTIRWIDQTSTKEWDDDATVLTTIGNASALHEVFPVDVQQISGDAAAADNLEAAADGTGYSLGGTTLINAVRDALLDRVVAGNHDTDGTVGKLLQSLGISFASGTAAAATAGATALTITGLAMDASKYSKQYVILQEGDAQGFASEILATSTGTTFNLKDALPAAVTLNDAVLIVGKAR